jgi:hypothetical protein
VATSATIRRSEPLPAAPTITWPRTAAILDVDGARLTDVDVVGPPRAGRILLGDAAESSALLDYVFGHGRRHVVLSFGDGALDGRLGTSWEGSRRSWWIELDQ